MSQPYIGEIRIAGFNFAPVGWAFCNGQLLSIADNDVLFAVIGTTYGGDGVTTFALPNLQSRVPVHQGTGSTGTPYVIGQNGGAETVTVTPAQLPNHTHAAACNPTASSNAPAGNVWSSTTGNAYTPAGPGQLLSPVAIAPTGGNQPHDNLPPLLVANFIISLYGIFPTQN